MPSRSVLPYLPIKRRSVYYIFRDSSAAFVLGWRWIDTKAVFIQKKNIKRRRVYYIFRDSSAAFILRWRWIDSKAVFIQKKRIISNKSVTTTSRTDHRCSTNSAAEGQMGASRG